MNSRADRQSLDQRRNAALDAFRDAFRVEQLRAVRVRSRRDRLALFFDDGSEALIHVASHRAGLPAGEFELFPTLTIRGGPVQAVIESLDLDPGTGFGDGRVLVATLKLGGGRQDVFAFRHCTDIGRQARRMSLAVARRFGPVVTAFTDDYGRAARLVVLEPRWVPLPWCTAMTLFGLAGDQSAAADLLARAEADPTCFPDLAQTPDPRALAATIRRQVRATVPP